MRRSPCYRTGRNSGWASPLRNTGNHSRGRGPCWTTRVALARGTELPTECEPLENGWRQTGTLCFGPHGKLTKTNKQKRTTCLRKGTFRTHFDPKHMHGQIGSPMYAFRAHFIGIPKVLHQDPCWGRSERGLIFIGGGIQQNTSAAGRRKKSYQGKRVLSQLVEWTKS